MYSQARKLQNEIRNIVKTRDAVTVCAFRGFGKLRVGMGTGPADWRTDHMVRGWVGRGELVGLAASVGVFLLTFGEVFDAGRPTEARIARRRVPASSKTFQGTVRTDFWRDGNLRRWS